MVVMAQTIVIRVMPALPLTRRSFAPKLAPKMEIGLNNLAENGKFLAEETFAVCAPGVGVAARGEGLEGV